MMYVCMYIYMYVCMYHPHLKGVMFSSSMMHVCIYVCVYVSSSPEEGDVILVDDLVDCKGVLLGAGHERLGGEAFPHPTTSTLEQ